MPRQKLEGGGTLMSVAAILLGSWERQGGLCLQMQRPLPNPRETDFKFLACRRGRGYVYVDCMVKFVVSKSNGLRNCRG